MRQVWRNLRPAPEWWSEIDAESWRGDVVAGLSVAVVLIPVSLVIFFLLRKNGMIKWTTVDLRASAQRPNPSGTPGRPPVIDHDPNDVTIER